MMKGIQDSFLEDLMPELLRLDQLGFDDFSPSFKCRGARTTWMLRSYFRNEKIASSLDHS